MKTDYPNYHHPKMGTRLEDYDIKVIDGILTTNRPAKNKQHPHFESWMLQMDIQVENTTFGQFWDLIKPNMNTWSDIFAGEAGFHDLTVWSDQMNDELSGGGYTTPHYISVTRFIEVWDKFPATNSFNFGGYGEYPIATDNDELMVGGIGIGFDGLRWTRDVPFFIDETFKIEEAWTRENPIPKVLVDSTCELLLSDVLSSIFHEITFYGYPEEHIKLRDELNETMDGIKNGSIKTYPIEDLCKDIRKDIEDE